MDIFKNLGLNPELVKELYKEGKLVEFLKDYQRLVSKWTHNESIRTLKEAIDEFAKPNGTPLDVLVGAYVLRSTLDPEAMADSSRRQLAENNEAWERRLEGRIREIRAESTQREDDYQRRIAELEKKVVSQGRKKSFYGLLGGVAVIGLLAAGVYAGLKIFKYYSQEPEQKGVQQPEHKATKPPKATPGEIQWYKKKIVSGDTFIRILAAEDPEVVKKGANGGLYVKDKKNYLKYLRKWPKRNDGADVEILRDGTERYFPDLNRDGKIGN